MPEEPPAKADREAQWVNDNHERGVGLEPYVLRRGACQAVICAEVNVSVVECVAHERLEYRVRDSGVDDEDNEEGDGEVAIFHDRHRLLGRAVAPQRHEVCAPERGQHHYRAKCGHQQAVVEVRVVDAREGQDEAEVAVDEIDDAQELLVGFGVLDTRHVGILERHIGWVGLGGRKGSLRVVHISISSREPALLKSNNLYEYIKSALRVTY